MSDLHHPADYHRAMDAAKERAGDLRRDAIDDFWNGAGDGVRHVLRSAARLAHSLARHARPR